MNARHSRITQGLLACVVAGTITLAGSSAAAQMTPGWACYWAKVNADRDAAGMCYGDYGPVGRVYQDGVITSLTTDDRPISWAYDINDRGQVAGTSWDLNWVPVPFVWHDGVFTLLKTMGGVEGRAWAVNARGDVIGGSTDAAGVWHNVLWREGEPVDIASLGCPISPWDINNRREMVGTDSTGHAILCRNGGWVDLTPNAEGWVFPLAINDRTQIVGYIDLYPAPTRLFLWDRGVLTDLGGFGGDWGMALDINNRGQVVGQSRNSDGYLRAFEWENGDMRDLTPAGYNEAMASGINEAGQVVGAAEGQAWVWLK